ncbi:MAG TPA: NAD(P)H-dependent oxidoreductase [Parachlamydiaceae bacterium]|nr:NAD(P)H-dependent oxidoreductase [Parachlamydiaceae bacterium]
MPEKPKILAFAGSLREDSCNKKLVKIAAEGARKAGAEVNFIDLKDYPLPIYDQEIETAEGIPHNAQKIKELMIASQGFLISSPEYNSSISGALKNAIDWASRPSKKDEAQLICFKDKFASLMSASPGALGGLRGLVHLKAILGNIDVVVLPQQQTISNAYEAFNAEGKLTNERHQASTEQLGAGLANMLTKLQG